MSHPVTLGKQGFFATLRKDTWWVEPALVAGILTLFGLYSTISAVLLQTKFEVGPYLSPFYEPLLRPSWWPFSPAILILWAPLGFRATCYYYRGAYYKAFFMNPPACSVTGYTSKNFRGESKFPFTIMNLHRFFLIFALALNVFLWVGAFKSFRYEGEWGIGVGSIVLTVNAFLLMMYSFSCHSLRHVVGGRLDCFSCVTRTRKATYDKVSDWNDHHKKWAWMSLFSVAIADIYIRLVANGIITDINTWSAPLRVIH